MAGQGRQHGDRRDVIVRDVLRLKGHGCAIGPFNFARAVVREVGCKQEVQKLGCRHKRNVAVVDNKKLESSGLHSRGAIGDVI